MSAKLRGRMRTVDLCVLFLERVSGHHLVQMDSPAIAHPDDKPDKVMEEPLINLREGVILISAVLKIIQWNFSILRIEDTAIGSVTAVWDGILGAMRLLMNVTNNNDEACEVTTFNHAQ